MIYYYICVIIKTDAMITFKDLNNISDVIKFPEKLEADIRATEVPAALFGFVLNRNVRGMRLSQLVDFAACEDHFSVVRTVVHDFICQDITDGEIENCDAFELMRYVYLVTDEVQKINELFQSIQPEQTAEELMARPPQFGVMGLVDYAMKRFGLHCYDDALQLKAIEVWQAMKIDNETAAYQRRLQAIYNRKSNKNR